MGNAVVTVYFDFILNIFILFLFFCFNFNLGHIMNQTSSLLSSTEQGFAHGSGGEIPQTCVLGPGYFDRHFCYEFVIKWARKRGLLWKRLAFCEVCRWLFHYLLEVPELHALVAERLVAPAKRGASEWQEVRVVALRGQPVHCTRVEHNSYSPILYTGLAHQFRLKFAQFIRNL